MNVGVRFLRTEVSAASSLTADGPTNVGELGKLSRLRSSGDGQESHSKAGNPRRSVLQRDARGWRNGWMERGRTKASPAFAHSGDG